MKGDWSAAELAEYLGVPASTLTYWVAAGLISPDKAGRGRAGHSIGLLGLLEALAVKELRGSGVSLQAIRKVVGNLQELFKEKRPLAKLTLVVYGDDVQVKVNGVDSNRVSALIRPGQSVMIFPLGEAYEGKVKELAEAKNPQQSEVLVAV